MTKYTGRAITTLSGYEVNSVGLPASNNSYLGIDLASSGWTTTNFTITITVYGGTEATFVSFFYVAFEPNTINALINTQHLAYSKNRAEVGCVLHPNGCLVSSPVSNTTFQT